MLLLTYKMCQVYVGYCLNASGGRLQHETSRALSNLGYLTLRLVSGSKRVSTALFHGDISLPMAIDETLEHRTAPTCYSKMF